MTCPKCDGFIIYNHDEWYCVNCSYRPIYRNRPPKERPHARHQRDSTGDDR